MAKTKSILLSEREVMNNRIAELEGKAELTDAEKNERENLLANYQNNLNQFQALDQEEREAAHRETGKSAEATLREFFASARQKGEAREVTLAGALTNGQAFEVDVKDVIPHLTSPDTLPAALNIVTGVVGNTIYPTAKGGVEVEEIGEVADATEQSFDLDNVTVTPHRLAISVDISNAAIDNASFPLLQYTQNLFNRAMADYMAKKVYSQYPWSGNKGGFSGLTPSTTKITISTGYTAYAAILSAVADFTDKGFDAKSLCLTIDAVTEANLKATPKAEGQGGFIIENGKLAGYDYTVSPWINTTKSASGDDIVSTDARYLGIGYYDYLAVQQHGESRLTVDATSKAVSKKNCTNVTLNTELSMTNLSSKLYDKDGNVVSAFALYELA